MSQMVELNLRPDARSLRQFGWIALGGFGLLALLPRDPRILKETRALLESGYAVDVLCLRHDGQKKTEDVDGVRVY